MAMSMRERKAAQRARPEGYAKSRVVAWKQQGIQDANYTRYLEKIVAQHSKCAICGRTIDSHAPLDHSHVSGTMRGVLCNRCNLLLGKVEFDKAFLRNVEAYLEQWRDAA